MIRNPTNNNREELQLRISKMISEGGLGVEAYYPKEYETETELTKTTEEVLAARMISEGGLGAEIYYYLNEKMTNPDSIEDTEQFVN